MKAKTSECGFETVELRAGTIVRAEIFAQARRPAYLLWIDLGKELGVRKSSARITDHYGPDELVGRQVVCVTNLPSRQIGPINSEVLVTGFFDAEQAAVLAIPDRPVPNGSRLA